MPRRLFSPDDPSPFELLPGDIGYTNLDDDLAAEEEAWDREVMSLNEQEASQDRTEAFDRLPEAEKLRRFR